MAVGNLDFDAARDPKYKGRAARIKGIYEAHQRRKKIWEDYLAANKAHGKIVKATLREALKQNPSWSARLAKTTIDFLKLM